MKKRIFALLGCMVLIASLFAFGASAKSGADLLVDNANLLTATQRTEVISLLNEVSDEVNCDVAVLTVLSLGDKTEVAYADDYYDQNGYGRGESGQDGVLLLVSMEERVWYVSTCGSCISTVDYDSVGDHIQSALSAGNYADAFRDYANEVKREIIHETSFFNFTRLLVALGIGALIALIVVSSMKAKLKSVRFQPAANNYLKPGSLNVTMAQEVFLYNTVTRTAKPKDNDSGGSHMSSGGVSHGGGGGHF